jgi:dihydroorotate dehydrogenase (NAD+) catalytic subunit
VSVYLSNFLSDPNFSSYVVGNQDKKSTDRQGLEVRIAGLHLKSPLLLASSLGGSGRDLKKLAREGNPGALITETISWDPSFEAHPELDPGKDQERPLSATEWFTREIPVALKSGVPVIARMNFGAVSAKPWVEAARMAADSGAAAVELSLSGQVSGITLLYHPDRLGYRIVEMIKEAVTIPVFVETPYLYPLALKEIVGGLVDSGTDAVVTAGNIVGTQIDVKSVMSGKTAPPRVGAIQGHTVKPISMAMAQLVASQFTIPVIGTGSVRFGEDVIGYVMVGAAAVQLDVDSKLKNPRGFQKLDTQILNWMRAHGVKSLSDIRGNVLGLVGRENNEPYLAVVDEERCSACRDCETICASITFKSPDLPPSAIWIPEDGKVAEVIKDRCVGCGWCKIVCHRDAIVLEGFESGL